MAAYLVLLFAALSRCIPHWTHTVGVGLTASGAGLLFFGSRLNQRSRWQSLFAVALFVATDYYLTVFAYAYPFHAAGYVLTWMWYAAVVLFASYFLSSKRTMLRVIGGALFSSTGFFFLSNAEVWWGSNMYPHSLAGLGMALAAGLPFYHNDLAGTLLFSAVLFGIPVLLKSFEDEVVTLPR